MTITKLGVATIGSGGVAHMHTQGFQQNPAVNVIGTYSRSQDKRDAFAQEYGIKSFESVEALLADPQVEAVAILTPTPTHLDYAVAAMKAGKQVLLEKPVASSSDELRTLIETSKATGQLCMPNHNYIYSPEVQRGCRYIREGKLGDLSSLWMIYNQKHWPSMGEPGLTLWELCIHHVYTLLHLAGRPLRVTATGSNIFFDDPDAHDQISMQFEYESGLIAHLWGSFAVDDRTSSPWNVMYKVLGTDGGFTHSWNDLQFGEAEQPGWDLAGYRESFAYSQARFVECCLNKEQKPLSTLEDTLDAYTILYAVDEAIANRTWVDIQYNS